MHESDAKLLRLGRRRDPDRLSIEHHLAAVRLNDAVDHVHQGRLPGPVLPRDCMDLAAAQLEIHVAQRLDRAERLAETRYLQNDFARHGGEGPLLAGTLGAIRNEEAVPPPVGRSADSLLVSLGGPDQRFVM